VEKCGLVQKQRGDMVTIPLGRLPEAKFIPIREDAQHWKLSNLLKEKPKGSLYPDYQFLLSEKQKDGTSYQSLNYSPFMGISHIAGSSRETRD